ncbi:YgaP family membrane protein [Halobacterium yunchengense]|uniref:YgaP family membrane protein n=1 Tax=Halobacterium yunchengense TaxID=3108497 RepID=UPI003008DE1E
MEANVGSTDKTVRLAVGGLLAAAGVAVLAGDVAASPLLGAVAVAAGAILVGTALTRFCLVYRLLGVNTCRP